MPIIFCFINGPKEPGDVLALQVLQNALRAERDRLATDLGIRSEILEEVANGTTPATRTSIQARHEQLWAEIAKK